MTLYDRMISQADDLEQTALKALGCSPHHATMIGCSQYFRECAAVIKGWAKDICMDCAGKDDE